MALDTMSHESFTFTVGKLDAGMAILLGERAHLIEFPSILLPPGATTGSIVNIAVHQNHAEEKRRDAEFWALQDEILQEFGVRSPEPPKLQLRNVTQTSITLEWPPIELATAKLRSLDIYRNGQRLAPIPSPLTNTSSKLSGLELNTEYTFQLVLRTSAGTYPSNLIRVRTHTMNDTSGISVCFGTVQDSVMLENAKMALREMKAKWSDKIQIDTTHFVCTTHASKEGVSKEESGSGSPLSGAPGVEYQRALQLSIPVVQPHWIFACHTERKLVSIAAYNLGATPPTPALTTRPHSMSQASIPRSPTSPAAGGPGSRQSMPPLARRDPGAPSPPAAQASSFVNAAPSSATPPLEPTPEEGRGSTSKDDGETEEDAEEREARRRSVMEKRMSRTGTMNREFKFPTPVSSPVVSDTPNIPSIHRVVTPSNIEVPPPPPVEKEVGLGVSPPRSAGGRSDEGEEEVGETVDIPLN
ncbi:Chitin biosynthesis protein CHS5 [Mycena venus]|uniref:Chitin biosynthesis protein CHS5 n=1 Tax=Mycena venus TaxID=2733690 RepID=A0A8H7CP95_9AGAR|nr:Chitin biosynthesis protein CHS5 [Mycena venus]